MLRFESPDLSQEVLNDIGIHLPPPLQVDSTRTISGEPISEDVTAEGIPKCPNCDKNMLHFEQARLWICQDSPYCGGTLPSSIIHAADAMIEDESLGQQLELQWSICDSPMVIRHGLFTRVVCTASDCNVALNRRLAASILRILKRRKIV